MFYEDGFEANIAKFFRESTANLIKSSSLRYAGSKRSLDVVRDITNVTPILWLAQRFAIPLKTVNTPKGLLTLPQLFDMFVVLFIYQNFNVIPANEWKLREASNAVEPVLRQIMETHLKTQQGVKEKIVDAIAKGSAYEVGPDADRLYHALNDSKKPIGDLVTDCIGMGAPVAGIVSQQGSLLIETFLKPEYQQYKERIVELAHKDDAASDKELQGFVFEGMRHAGIVPGFPHVATNDITVQDGERGPVAIHRDQIVLAATSSCAMDPLAFPEPEKLNPHRPVESYNTMLGHGLHSDIGARLIGPALVATLKEVFKLKNVRAAPGKRGHFTTTTHKVAGVPMKLFLDPNCKESPIPTTLTIEYDE